MPAPHSKPSKLITAIVCTYNRYDVLADALVSLAQQSLPRSDYEVIVVDNSTDLRGQRNFWRRSRKRFDVNLLIQAEPGLSKARNAGLQATNAPIVAFSDDDAVASPNWLASLVGLFQDEPNAGIGGGPVVPIWPGSPPPWLHPWLSGFFTIVDRGEKRRALAPGEWLAGTNVAFRRDPLMEAGGFDEKLGRRGTRLLSNEDLEVIGRIRELGLKTYYEPAALVYHKVHADRIDQSWLRRRIAWQKISDALLPTANGSTEPQKHWDAIARYALRVPPEMRSFRGLFLNTDNPETFQRQCDAIAALMALMMECGRDPDAAGE